MKQQYDEVWIGDDARCYRNRISRDAIADIIFDRDKENTYVNRSDLGLSILNLSGVTIHCFIKAETTMYDWVCWGSS